MSRAFTKEGDQEEIPMVPPRAYLPEGTPNYVTKEGLAALNEELASLQTELAKAGDNYIMSNFIEAKMKLLIGRINSAVEVDVSKAKKGIVSFGAWVRYNGRVVRIVGVDEANVNQGLLSFTSPLAKSLMGKKAGEVIELKGPRGLEKIIVEEVSFEPMALTQLVSDKPSSSSLPHQGTKSSSSLRGASATKQSTVDKCGLLRSARNDGEVIDQTFDDDELNNETAISNKVEEQRSFIPEVDPMEFLPIVNERGNIIGRALYVELHNGNKMLHPVAHLHVLNGTGETTRLYWWHVAFGDTPEKTLQRKITEVLALSGVKPRLKRQYIRETKTEKELVYVFTIVSKESLPLTPEGKDYLNLFEKD